MNRKLSVIIIEDSESDMELIVRQFKKADYNISYERVETAAQMISALERQSWDLVIADYNLPEFDASSALTILQKYGLDIPFIVVSGIIGEETAIALMKAGAHDCIMKNKLARLIPVVNRELSEAQTRRERQEAEEQLKEEQERFRSIFSNSADGILLALLDGTILNANPAACHMLGRSEEEICQVGRAGIVDLSDSRFIAAQEERKRTGKFKSEHFHIHKNGTRFLCEVSSNTFKDKDGHVMACIIFRDITESKRMAEEIEKAADAWRTTFDSIEDMIMILDLNYRILRVNGILVSFLGLSYDDILGMHVFDLIHWIQHPPEECPLARMLNTKRHEELETYIDEKEMWILASVDPIFDNNGSVTGGIYIIKNITARKKAEVALRESEIKFQTLMNGAPMAISWSDTLGNIEYCNRKFTELFGYAAEDIPTVAKWRSLAYPDPAYRDSIPPLNFAIIEAQKEGKTAEPKEVIVTCKDGSTCYAEQTGVMAYNRFMVVYDNITERKRAEEALRESENKFRDLVEKSFVGVYLVQDNIFRYVNARFAEIHGYMIEEMVDKIGILETVLSEDLKRVTDNIRKRSTGELESVQYENRIITKQGVIRNVAIYGARTTYRGKPASIGTLMDITEQKRAEEALRESENKFRDLVEKSLVGVYLIQDNLFKYVNTRFAEIHGCAIEEMVDKKGTLDIILPEDILKMRDNVRKGLKGGGGSFKTEFRIATKQGEIRNVEVYGTYTLYQGKPAIIGTLVDITEQKRADEMLMDLFKDLEKKNVELENTYDELRESQQKIIQQEKMASIGQLAAGIAHEINNPVGFVMSNINSMGKYSERLFQFIKIQSEAVDRLSKQDGDTAVVLDGLHKKRRALKIDYVINDFTNVIKESLEGTERVKRIVQDLKNFSHKDEDEHKPADINEGIESTINVVWNELKYKANVTKEYGKIPLTKCNLGQLNQVFMNLLINAVQAIEEHGEISIKTERRDGDIVVSISDTGSGIQEDKMNRIFEPFFTTKEVGKGTGLGLSIAYDIVKKHSGEILVTSEIGKGSTFTITIPVVER